MNAPKLSIEGLKKAKAWEIALRFAFGGAVTVATGLVDHRWGPVIGGLFLAFPAILPASLTLVKDHDGRAKAADDARGSRLGAVGLAAFGITVWMLCARTSPAISLGAAMIVWLVVSVAAWTLAERHSGTPPRT